jgi:hypothetical protein
VLGVVYFCFMMVGAAIVRVPAPGWKPEGYVAPAQPKKLITTAKRLRLSGAEDAAVLADLVGAVPERHRRHRRDRPGLGDEPGDVPRPGHRVAAAGFVGLMSLFNMGGRFFWASTSDYIGRKNTYFCFFALGTVLYALVPTPARSAASRCSCCASWSSSACMAAASPPCRPICGHVRHALCRRHPRHADHRLVGWPASSGRCW